MTANKIGFVFPGQGSQSVGMLAEIAKTFPLIEKVFHEASTVLNYDLWKLVSLGPAEELDKTAHTQPALLAASFALFKIITSQKKIIPTLLAGHSLGEYTALVAANAISFQDGIRLVAARGEYMQAAVPVGMGALAAIIGLDNATVKNICDQSVLNDEVLAPANFNSEGQVVIAGHKAAVERAIILAKEKGSRLAKMLPVSVPSHSALMKPAADRLEKLLQTITIKKPEIPVLNNVDVKIYEDENMIRDGLVRQLCMPVRFVEMMQFFQKENISEVIECGPGKVLTGLVKRILPTVKLNYTDNMTALNETLEQIT